MEKQTPSEDNIKELLWIYAVALDSGYVRLADLIAWADSQVIQIETPPRWLLELCTAKTQNEALGILLIESDRYMETIGRGWADRATRGDLYLGLLYLRFERRDLTMAQLLNLSGQYSDASGHRIDCETFYYILNEIDGGGPTIPSTEPLEDRAAKLFAPMASLARQLLGNLPAAIPGEH